MKSKASKSEGRFDFQEVPKSAWPLTVNPPIKVFKSSVFLVQVYAELSEILRLSILKIQRDSNTQTWTDGITWDELQEIKNTVGYENYCAVEVYPEKHNVVNVAAIRHLWVLPTRPDFVWCAK